MSITHEMIRDRAYQIWQRTGNEDALSNWLEAERELLAARGCDVCRATEQPMTRIGSNQVCYECTAKYHQIMEALETSEGGASGGMYDQETANFLHKYSRLYIISEVQMNEGQVQMETEKS